MIAADPDTHGTGLGRALTVAGLDHLAAAGPATSALLYVEADNDAGDRALRTPRLPCAPQRRRLRTAPARRLGRCPRPTRYDLDRDGWSELLAGEQRFRLEQVWNGLYHQGRDLSELTNLPDALRDRLIAEAARWRSPR